MADLTKLGDLEGGIVLAREGRKEAAYIRLRQALFTEGDSAFLRIWLAGVAPTVAETVTHLERAQALEPGNPQVVTGLAWARQQLAAAGGPPPAPLQIVPPNLRGTPLGTRPRGTDPLNGGPAASRPPEVLPAWATAAPSPFGPAPAPGAASAGAPGRPAAALPVWAQAPPSAPVSPVSSSVGGVAPFDYAALDPPAAPAALSYEVSGVVPFDYAALAGPAGPANVAAPEEGTTFAYPADGAPPTEDGVSPTNGSAPTGSVRPYGGISKVPRAPLGGPAPAYPAAPVVPPRYGVFEEAHVAVQDPPPPSSLARPFTGRPAAPPVPARARRRSGPLLLVLVVLLALLGLTGLALNTGTFSAAVARLAPPTPDATGTAAAADLAATTATAEAAAAATLTAVPAATAQAAGQAYQAAAADLLQQVRAEDGEIVNMVHQADTGVIGPKAADTGLKTAATHSASFRSQADALGSPPAYRQHQATLVAALDLRAQALDSARQYAQKLDQVAQAVGTAQDADQTFKDAYTSWNQSATRDNYISLLRAKQARDTAVDQLSRLRTYADEDHQRFLTLWTQYEGKLPPAP